MQLTGKQVYEAARPHLVKCGFEDLNWEDFEPDAFYVDLAARLNEQFITPLQGLMDKLHGEFKALKKMDRAIFDEQDEQINALKALVKDYHAALVAAHERKLNAANAFALEKRKRVLLEGEVI